MNAMRRILMVCLAGALSASGVAPVVTGFDLLDADTGALITSLQNNDTLDLNALGQRALRVRANLSGSGSVQFLENGWIEYTANSAPYIMGGDWLPAPGSYTLTATPWSGPDAAGESGSPLSIHVTVVDALSHRMRPIRIQSSVPDIAVQIRMLKHAFPFGSMTKPGIEVPGTYQDTFFSNFNYSVVGNDMKWYSQQPEWWNQSPHNTGYAKPGNYRYDNADTWLDFQEAQGIPVRGHTLFWGGSAGDDHITDPDWVRDLVISNQTEALYWMEARTSNIVSRFAGRIDEWDFINEMWHGDRYRDEFGPSITKQMADWAIAANPDVELWFNEYSMLSNSNNAAAFRAYLQMLQGEGVQIDGVGVQGHFGSAPNAATVKVSLDILDDLGLPIKVTEFDCGSTNMTETQMADGLETVYRTAFEHPAVEGIIMWGFWESNHWKPERALWKTDWTPTEQAFRYRELVYGEWWSDADLLVDQNGELEANLFAGDFEITINGQAFTNSLSAGNGQDTFFFDGTDLIYLAAPEVVLTEPVNGAMLASGPAVRLAADASGGGSVSSVDFLLDGSPIKTDSQPPYTAVQYDVAPGSHDVAAVARNIIGVSTTSSVVAITVEVGNGNLIDNPGFESGTANWSNHGGHSIGTVSSPVYAGSSAGVAFDRNNTYDGLSQTLTGELIAGRTYVVACRVRLGTGSEEANIVLKTSYNTNSPKYEPVAGGMADSTGWSQLKGEFTFAPDPLRTVTEARIYIANVAVGTNIYVDSVFCAETTLATVDYDSDGMPDQWEETHFGSIDATNGGAFEDWDGDGVANRAEYRSGTVPTDPASRLAIVSLQPNAGQMDVSWQSVAGKSYRVLTSTNLVAGGWTTVEEGIAASGTNTATSVGAAATSRFIRIELDE